MRRNDILLHVKILLTLAFTENAEKTKTIDFKRSYLGRTEDVWAFRSLKIQIHKYPHIIDFVL